MNLNKMIKEYLEKRKKVKEALLNMNSKELEEYFADLQERTRYYDSRI